MNTATGTMTSTNAEGVHATSSAPCTFAPQRALDTIVKHAPLTVINLLVEDHSGHILLGLRRRTPARGYWFVPEDRILKNESIQQAVQRIAFNEAGVTMDAVGTSVAAGIFEHFYPDNPGGTRGFGTHHIVIAHRLKLRSGVLPGLSGSSGQHLTFRWMSPRKMSAAIDVHPYTRAYAGCLSDAIPATQP